MKASRALFRKLCVSRGRGLYRRCVKGCPIVFLSVGSISKLACSRTRGTLVRLVKDRTTEFPFLLGDSGLSRARGRRCHNFAVVRGKGCYVSGNFLVSSLGILTRLLCGRCSRGTVVLVSRCSIPLSGTFRRKCCGRVMSLVQNLFKRTLGAGDFLRFTMLANYLHISGRDVFAKLGGFGICSTSSIRCSRRFKFAARSMGGVLTSCGRRSRFRRVGR